MDNQEILKYINENFNDKEKDVILQQVTNFNKLKELKLKDRKYKIGDDVVLEKGIFMTGFNADMDYLEKISNEGKISGDFQGFPTCGGVKYAVSLWKFDKPITLHDYIIQYSGITAVWDDEYAFVPFGKIDAFTKRLKKENVFCWNAESTRECRFLPSISRDTNQIALIFNMKNKAFKPLLENDCRNLVDCPTITMKTGSPDPHNREMNRFMEIFGNRTAYPLYGIPRNCIEGLFVARALENKKILKTLKDLFPDCYICNLDGKVIVE